jgi:hypothetical protein
MRAVLTYVNRYISSRRDSQSMHLEVAIFPWIAFSGLLLLWLGALLLGIEAKGWIHLLLAAAVVQLIVNILRLGRS